MWENNIPRFRSVAGSCEPEPTVAAALNLERLNLG